MCQVEVGDDAAAAFAEDGFAVGVVDVDHSAVGFAGFGDFVEGGDVAVHAEDAVGDDEDAPVGGVVFAGFVEDAGEVVGVAVVVDGAFGGAEADAVDDAAVVELVADDEVAFTGELGDEARVGGEAGLVDEAGFGVFELGEAAFEFLVEVEVAGDGADAAAADAVGFDGFDGGFLEFGVRAQAQVVVGAEHDDFLAFDDAAGAAGALEFAEAPVEFLLDEGLVFFFEKSGRITFGRHFGTHLVFFHSTLVVLIVITS